MYTSEYRKKPWVWNELHDEIAKDVEEHWSVYDLFRWKAQRLHEGHLTDIIEAVVQDLYQQKSCYTDIKEIFVEKKHKEYGYYCACGIPPEGKTSEEYEDEYKAIYDTFEELFENLIEE